MADDVVAELRHWCDQGVSPPLQLLRRAISEIEALRDYIRALKDKP